MFDIKPLIRLYWCHTGGDFLNNIFQYIDSKDNEMISSLQELIRIRSVKDEPLPNMPYGKPINDALLHAISLAKSLGLDATNLDGHMALIDYGNGEETLGILAHLDVVPEGAGWVHPPYEAVIDGGKMFGRGTTDDKGAAVCALYALAAIKQSGVALNRKVRIMLGCDEESGWGDMAYYKAHQPLPDLAFSPDCEYPVINAEKGVLQLDVNKSLSGCNSSPDGLYVVSLKGGNRVNMVPDYAEAILKLSDNDTIESIQTVLGNDFVCTVGTDSCVNVACHGVSAHGSTPELGKNAICLLATALQKLDLSDCPTTSAINFISTYICGESDGLSLGLSMSDDASGSLTLNLGVIELISDKLLMQWDIRYPISFKPDDVLEKIGEAVSDFRLSVNVRHSLPPLFVDPNSEIVQKLLRVYARQTNAKSYCRYVGGATYARAMPNAVSFGPNMESDEHLAHQANEYVSLEMLNFNTRMIADAIVTLCT